MNRTPRSASRRASRQLAANEPSPPCVPYRSRTCLRLVRHVHQLGHAGLHLERHLVLGDAGGDLRDRRRLVRRSWLSALHGVDDVALLVARDARRAADVEHRVALGRGTRRPGSGWAGSPLCHCRAAIGCVWPNLPVEVSTTKPGRSSRLAAQAVGQPRAHRRPAGDRRAGVHERVGRVVVDRLGLQRADDADVVGDRRRCAGRARRSPGPTCRTS